MKLIRNYDDPYEIGRVVRWEERERERWRRYAVWPPNASIETCAKRVIYGGRKGRQAARRLSLWSYCGHGPVKKVTKYVAYAILCTEEEDHKRAIAQFRLQYKRGVNTGW